MAGADAYVLDASVAVKWHLADEEHTDRARELLRQFGRGVFGLLAPEHIRYEVPNAITAATRRRPTRLTLDQGTRVIAEFLRLDLVTFGDAALFTAAYPLAHRYECAFYDAVYLALAERTDCPLATADHRLSQRIQALPHVIWIGDWGE